MHNYVLMTNEKWVNNNWVYEGYAKVKKGHIRRMSNQQMNKDTGKQQQIK